MLTVQRLVEVVKDLGFECDCVTQRDSAGRITVTVVAKKFEGLDEGERQRIVLTHLIDRLTEDEMAMVDGVFTLSPAEADPVGVDDAVAPPASPDSEPRAVVDVIVEEVDVDAVNRKALRERLAPPQLAIEGVADEEAQARAHREIERLLKGVEQAKKDLEAREADLQRRVAEVAEREVELSATDEKLRQAERELEALRERVPNASTPDGAVNESLAQACRVAREQRDKARKDLAEAQDIARSADAAAVAAKAQADKARVELQAERDVASRLREALRAIERSPMPAAHFKTHDARKCDAAVCIAKRALERQVLQPLEVEREEAQRQHEAERDKAVSDAAAWREHTDRLYEEMKSVRYLYEVLLATESVGPHTAPVEAALQRLDALSAARPDGPNTDRRLG